MKLVNLIDEIRGNTDITALIQRELGIEIFESIELCMNDSMSLESEVKLFDSDAISDRINFQVAGISYINLCPFEMLVEFVNATKSVHLYSSLSIAERFMDYIENDT